MPQARVNGLNIYYQDGGQGPPALFLPGLGSDHNIWAPVVSRLRCRLRCITVDSRGAGRSDSPNGPLSIAAMAQDALALLRHLELERVHLVGFSMGGMVAQEMALSAPQAVYSLTLVSSFARADARLASLLRAQREILHRLGRQDFYRLSARWLFGRWTQQNNRSLVDGFVRAAARAPNPQLERTFDWQVEAVCAYDSSVLLGQLRLPVQVVAGEEDLLTPLRMARELAEAIPGAALHVVPRAGHLLVMEQPEAVARLVSGFIGDAKLGQGSP